MDLYTASRDIKDLIRKGIVRLPKKGGRVYELIEPGTETPPVVEPMEPEIEALLKTQGFVRNEDVRQLLGLSRMQATWKLRKWVEAGLLRLEGRGRGARYYSATDSPREGGGNA